MTSNGQPPKGWRRVALKEICEQVNYGFTASANKEAIGPKFLRITDIVPPLIDWSEVPHCQIPEKEIEKYLLHEGDIVIARTGATTGYAKRIKKRTNAIFASYLVRIRIKQEHDNRFVGCVIESSAYKDFIKANLGGAAQPQANAQVLASFPILLPPLPTQRKIAAVFSAYDDLIENNTRRIKILEEMAQAIYREWFVDFRFPGHEKVKMVDSLPEGWTIDRLGNVATIVMGQSPRSEFYNTQSLGLPFHQGVRDFGPRFPIDRVYCTVMNRLAEAGDALFSVRAPVGRMNIASKRIVIGRGLAAIRSKAGHSAFLFEQLKDRFQEEDMIGGGTIFKSVTRDDMNRIEILSPTPKLVTEFDQQMYPIFSLIENLTTRIDNLRFTRDLLLPKLIAGEVDVSELDIQTERPARLAANGGGPAT